MSKWDKEEAKRTKGEHRPVRFPAKCHIPWSYCIRCGLMYLNNDVSRKAVRAACSSDFEE